MTGIFDVHKIVLNHLKILYFQVESERNSTASSGGGSVQRKAVTRSAKTFSDRFTERSTFKLYNTRNALVIQFEWSWHRDNITRKGIKEKVNFNRERFKENRVICVDSRRWDVFHRKYPFCGGLFHSVFELLLLIMERERMTEILQCKTFQHLADSRMIT